MFIWNTAGLARNLGDFQNYYNAYRAALAESLHGTRAGKPRLLRLETALWWPLPWFISGANGRMATNWDPTPEPKKRVVPAVEAAIKTQA